VGNLVTRIYSQMNGPDSIGRFHLLWLLLDVKSSTVQISFAADMMVDAAPSIASAFSSRLWKNFDFSKASPLAPILCEPLNL